MTELTEIAAREHQIREEEQVAEKEALWRRPNKRLRLLRVQGPVRRLLDPQEGAHRDEPIRRSQRRLQESSPP